MRKRHLWAIAVALTSAAMACTTYDGAWAIAAGEPPATSTAGEPLTTSTPPAGPTTASGPTTVAGPTTASGPTTVTAPEQAPSPQPSSSQAEAPESEEALAPQGPPLVLLQTPQPTSRLPSKPPAGVHARGRSVTRRDGALRPPVEPAGGVAPGPRRASSGDPPPDPLAMVPPSLTLTFPQSSRLLDFFIGAYRTPPFLLPVYMAAAERYRVPWQVLGAINEVESDYGYDLGVSSAGAEGWMQFLPSEWLAYGVDANGAGVRDPYNPADAVFAAARYLQAAGAAHNLRGAIYAYNHSTTYVESVMLRARLLREAPRPLIDGLAALADGQSPLAGKSALKVTPPGRDEYARIAAKQGAAVVAVKDSEVLRRGHSPRLGLFVELRDVYGDDYTYTELGALAHLPQTTLHMRAWVSAGTVLGQVMRRPSGGRAWFGFGVQPSGAKRIDPRPVLEAWRLLGMTSGRQHPRTGALFGPHAHDALLGEIRLMSDAQLRARGLARIASTSAASSSAPSLSARQWRKLASHLLRLGNPRVPATPTSAAVPDTAASAPPSAAPRPFTVEGLLEQTPASAAPVTLSDPGSILKGPVALVAVTEVPQSSIASVQFQYSPAETQSWTTIASEGPASASTVFETNSVIDGLYDLRVVLTDTAGGVYTATLPDRLIANSSPVVSLADPGSSLSGKIKLKAQLPTQVEQGEIASLTFQWSPSGKGVWTTIAEVSGPPFTATFDTSTVPDGYYDFRLVGVNGAGTTFASIPVRRRLVDNTPPTVSLANPGSPLRGRVTLSAGAEDSGSGVASVSFERARAGTSAWLQIGTATLPSQPHTYSRRLNTVTLDNGLYDFRATAIDAAGNRMSSGVLSGIEVDNPAQTATVPASITGTMAPAHSITILGSVTGGEQRETWAYGFTSAPPAEAEGKRLPYTADGEQLVLLRYTDRTGWQIADVLRNPDGTPFKLLEPAEVETHNPGENGVHVAGTMASSGEAWLWVAEPRRSGQAPVFGVFHRLPGGPFQLDPTATQTLSPLSEPSTGKLGPIHLAQGAGGQVVGMITAPSQPERQATVTGPSGTTIALNESLGYGLLQEGTWKLQTASPPPSGMLKPGQTVTLDVGDIQGPGAAWGAITVRSGSFAHLGLILGHLLNGQWTFAPTGLDALDLTGSVTDPKSFVQPQALKAEGSAVWIGAHVALSSGSGEVVARYDSQAREVTNSWCTLPVPNSCEEPLDLDHPAAVPDAIVQTATGPVGMALKDDRRVHIFADGRWTSIPAPGYTQTNGDAFSGPAEGWLGGEEAVGRLSPQSASPAQGPAERGPSPESSPLVGWPLPDRSPLTSVALPPASGGGVEEAGALAVGLDGTTLSYDPSAGWLVQPVPARAHHINLLSVAFAGPSSAFAVGQYGVILHWDGTDWSEDPQSISLTQSQLNAVAFSGTGEGWAVGVNGTILHYDGRTWSVEHPPAADEGVEITSVAVAGSEVFAVAGGNLIRRAPDGSWLQAPASLLPSNPAPAPGSLRVLAGLPDGGLVAAGRSTLLVREAAGGTFSYAAQPLEGVVVALAPFRQQDGRLRTFASVSPPVLNGDVAGFPPGDGELLRQTDAGWQDLSESEYAGLPNSLPGDGALKSDPVLAVAAGPGGEHAWAVGGYAGTIDAAGRGTIAVLPSRPAAWKTASIWRYDAAGSAAAPALTATTPSLPAKTGTVSFAFFTSSMCRVQCAAAPGAQPDVNLTAAAGEIAAYAAQPGGPAFAMLGGDARGPTDERERAAGEGAVDFAHLPSLLAPLHGLPTLAALGPLDYVKGQSDETQPWAEAFAGAPAPFGSGPAASAIAPVSSGAPTPTGVVRRYYSFDANQAGATLRVIVLDNSKGSLEKTVPGQTAWLEQQLSGAQGMPVVVIAAEPLRGTGPGAAGDGEAVATLLANSGVLAVFTGNGLPQLDEHHLIPEGAPPGAAQIPEYEGAAVGYQQPRNNGVMWYFVSVDTQARQVHVNAVPVIDSLSIKPLEGITVARSLTLQFEAVGRRPPGTLATTPHTTAPGSESEAFPGFDNYVEIPTPSCGARPCVAPSYAFRSSDSTIGDFVVPSGPGSPFPKLGSNGHPIPSSSSGLFCAYNSGTTTISVTAGLLSYSLPVTVKPGGFGSPCGTVYRPGVSAVVVVRSSQSQSSIAPAAAPPPTPAPLSGSAPPPVVPAPPPPPPPPVAAKAPAPAPAPPQPPSPSPPVESLGAPAAVPPPATPPIEPVPPGAGGYVQSPAAAERKEKAHKQASQSAFSIRPAGSGPDWFYLAVGITSLLAVMLSAQGLRAARRPDPALLLNHTRRDRR